MSGRLAESEFGYFDRDAREFVITRPDTPTPWINYLGEGRYGGIVSNTGGGFSFDRDPRARRVSRYRYNAVPADQPGRYVYIRRQDTGEFWGATWQPVRAALDSYECRHGAGYTHIRTERSGVRSELLYFVPPAPPEEPCPVELWELHLTNTGPRPVRLRTFSYVEFSYPDALGDLHNLDWSGHIVTTRFRPELNAIVATTRFRPTTTFFAADLPAAGYDCDREVFVGPYGTLETPAVVVAGEPTGTDSPRGNGIGCLCHDLSLAPGESVRILYVEGITESAEAVPATLARWSGPQAVSTAFAALRADWDAYLGGLTVTTPDPLMDAMLNFWNPVQCRTTLYWSRFVSGYETGLGRGMGTRDSAQDTLGTAQVVPELAAQRLEQLWGLQFRDGHTWHQFFPLTGEGGPGHAAERPSWPQWFCDDHLWLIIATCAYLRETADCDFLHRPVPYQPEPAPAGAEATADDLDDTVWGHLMAAVDFTLRNRGPHGLPRPGFADWDDTLNVDHGSGLAESVWCGMQFCRALTDLTALSEHIGSGEDAERFRALHQEMAEAVEACAWDGEWYARAFDDEGQPIGVAAEAHHRINLIAQSWSVIGRVGPLEHLEKAMQSAHDMLDTRYGLCLLAPPYQHGDPRVTGTSTYPPGAKENGGIFCHAAAWSIIAAAQLGQGDRAYEYYRQLLPLARADAARAAVEPYVYCQNICGPEHPQFGLGRNAWLTGAAAWTYVAATQGILGIRPTHHGLRLAPVIPAAWDGFIARRRFQGATYEITVRRDGPGNRVALTVDGRPIDGDVVPLHFPGTERVVVEAVLS
ncbi:MAG TPA: glycosyl transferase family 36 [Candidatus Binatia bacterium]|nr:glycosyl transferase family 36 [Candidatus Binatia bacterium]